MIVRRGHRPSFTVIDNRALDDERLTYKALGLLVFVLRQVDSWETNYRHLATRHADGEHAVRSALKELEQLGYIERRRERNGEGRFEWVRVIYEVPAAVHAADSLAWKTAAAETPAAESAPLVSTEVANTEQQEESAATAPLDSWPDNLPAVVVESGLLESARELNLLLEASLIERGFVDVAGKAIGKRWLLDMEALLRVDERPPVQVRWVIGWLSRGDDKVASFWRSNIRSPAKLRQQWAVMREQWHNLQRTTQSRTGQQFDRAVREAGRDPSEVAADTDALVRSMFGSDPVDEDRRPLTSEALDVESREAT